MKKCVLASLLALGLATPALAADKYFVIVDTVGNRSVLDAGPPSAGQTAIVDTGGYASAEDAKKALDSVRDDASKCKGVVE